MSKRRSTTEDLWAELLGHINSASKVLAPSKQAEDTPARQASRRKRVERALAARDMSAVREALPVAATDAKTKAQRVVIYAYAAVLEAESAGLSILFDRFNARERRQIEGALEDLGAVGTLRDFVKLRRAFDGAVRRGVRKSAVGEWLVSRPGTKVIDRSAARHVAEIEGKLLKYCREHLDEL